MLAATHWNGTSRSSIRSGSASASTSRNGSLECRCVRVPASVASRLTIDPVKTAFSSMRDHSSARRSTVAEAGEEAATAPLIAPTEVPMISVGVTPRSNSAALWSPDSRRLGRLAAGTYAPAGFNHALVSFTDPFTLQAWAGLDVRDLPSLVDQVRLFGEQVLPRLS